MKGIFSTCQASLVKGIIQVHATLLSQWKYITYNPWITESAAETIHISSVEYCKVFQQGLYPSDVCETRIRWKRCSIWEHCVYLGPSSWNGKCQNGGEQRQHLNRKCVCRRLTSRQRLGERGTRRHSERDSVDISAMQCKMLSAVRS